VVMFVAGCGSDPPSDTCTPEPCGNGMTYQACATPGTTHIRYVYGGNTCTCDSMSCNQCATAIAAYCTAGGTSGGTTAGTNRRTDGTACNLASDCCSNICHLGTCQACTVLGGSCSNSAECCGGKSCTGGLCGGPDSACTKQDAAGCFQCCAMTHSAAANKYDQ